PWTTPRRSGPCPNLQRICARPLLPSPLAGEGPGMGGRASIDVHFLLSSSRKTQGRTSHENVILEPVSGSRTPATAKPHGSTRAPAATAIVGGRGPRGPRTAVVNAGHGRGHCSGVGLVERAESHSDRVDDLLHGERWNPRGRAVEKRRHG